MEKTRIAIVSTDGVSVNEHFGKADHFLIYELDDQMTLVEKRDIETWSVGNPDHPFDPEKFSRIFHRLKDCRKIYVSRIGEFPAAKLRELGVEPVVYTGAIDEIAG